MNLGVPTFGFSFGCADIELKAFVSIGFILGMVMSFSNVSLPLEPFEVAALLSFSTLFRLIIDIQQIFLKL